MLLFAAVQPASEDAAPSIHIAFVTHGKRLAADTAVQTAVAAGQINGLAGLFVPEYSGAGNRGTRRLLFPGLLCALLKLQQFSGMYLIIRLLPTAYADPHISESVPAHYAGHCDTVAAAGEALRPVLHLAA